MAFKIASLLFLVTLLQIQNIESWPQNPWFNVIQALNMERQQTSIAISSLQQQTSWQINTLMAPLSFKLNQIKNQAKLQPTACAQKTLSDIDMFFASKGWIQECRNNVAVDILKAKQMQLIDSEFNKVNAAQATCQEQECIDKITAEVQDKMAQIREDTSTEINNISEEMSECVERRSGELVNEVNEIEENWKLC